ncbi:LURP-one-related/scramblase family protein [Limosilactobacillus sp.]|uniref:LURP-one-related/scramblase family protein n=1 Tax=Limosilactobacillus sp. TaxID=2773925 RepID=UPI003EFF99DE
MRKLYLRDHATDLHGTTIIRDEQGQSCYLLAGKWGLHHDVLSLYAIDGQLLAEVKQLSLGLLPKFGLYQNRQRVGIVGKSFGFVRQVVYIRGLNWIIVGSPLGNRYRVFGGGKLIFALKPVRFSGSYCHELRVTNRQDEPLAILIASVLDHWSRTGQIDTEKVQFRNRSLAGNCGMGYRLK